MSFEDHATFGPATIIGLKDRVYIGQQLPSDFFSYTEKKQKELYRKYMHFLGLTRNEADELVKGLLLWLEHGSEDYD